MNYLQCFTSMLLIASVSFAQTPEVSIENPKPIPFVQPLLRPFHMERRIVAPTRLDNSPRLESLVRAGNLYLSEQDVIALALENNIDIAVQRYAPFLAKEVIRRAESGAPLRSVGQPVAAGPVSVSTAGVTATAVALPSGSGVTSGGGLTAAIGTNPPNLDPSLFLYANFSHASTPLSNLSFNGVPALLNDSRTYQAQYTQSWTTGTTATLSFVDYHSAINSPFNVVNPYSQGDIDLYVTQNLLQGWGIPVNNRYIRVAKNNLKVSDLTFKLQVITTVSAILNLYWDLVSFNDDLRIKQKALETAQQFLEDNQRQVQLGTLPAIEVTRTQAEVSAAKEDLLIAQTNVAQQEAVLKNSLSRTGSVNSWLDDVHIVPLDSIVIPEKEDIKPTPELIEEALASRPELDQAKVNLESTKILMAGTKNNLLPALQAFAEVTNNGLSGSPNALCANLPAVEQPACVPSPGLVGGYGNLLGQIFRRNYPNYSAGISLNIPFRNRVAQGDYVADVLQERQGELQLQKTVNQVRVDVKVAVIGLQQARTRYQTAADTRKLQQQTLDAEQLRFKFGESTIATVVQDERDLATDQSAEVQAMANYTHAKIAFEQAIGQTLEANHISIEEAKAGHVERQSTIPANLSPEVTK